VKQAKIDQKGSPEGALTSAERQELNQLRRELKRVEMERDFLKKVATLRQAQRPPSSPRTTALRVSRGGEG
jgi:transposase-like protein